MDIKGEGENNTPLLKFNDANLTVSSSDETDPAFSSWSLAGSHGH